MYQIIVQPLHFQEVQETTTAQPDALTRLRNRPRLQVGAKAKLSPTQSPPGSRRQLVSGLLPRRRPAEQSTETAAVPVEESKVEEEPEVSEAVPTTVSSTEPAAPQGLQSLIGARRRLPGRRPGALPRPAPADE